MRNFIQWTLILLFVLVLGFNIVNNKQVIKEQPINNVKHVKITGVSVAVELALTPEAQTQGLSGRENLNEDEGMLFVFDDSEQHSFWMKDMNFPIDIIWIGENFEIAYIKKNAIPETYPEIFTPNMKTKYVLETVSGFADKNKLKEGDKVLFF